jgi:hypothetical protein
MKSDKFQRKGVLEAATNATHHECKFLGSLSSHSKIVGLFHFEQPQCKG